MSDLANIWLFSLLFCGVHFGPAPQRVGWVQLPTMTDEEMTTPPACYRGDDIGFPITGSKHPGADPRYWDA